MNDSTVKNLAITEKKAHKPGGCVGIFFQLFEWKRKLAKKKLFSKKLLLPARAKKFNGDEKMSNAKLHLITNENSGGFPSARKCGGIRHSNVDEKSEMQAPGLVARLMGLEYVPAVQQCKSKKALVSDSASDEEKEALVDNCASDRQDVDLEVGIVKHDSRPQKLQKTGTCEKMAVTRFGAEALQIKSVLSRAKKNNHNHHHPKLASPLKSPRINSGKSVSRSSRLIGAATKLLEPGLQARSRAKDSLTYPASVYLPRTGIVPNGVGTSSAVIQNQSCYDASTGKTSMGHTSCKNCGNFLDVIDCKPEFERRPAVPADTVPDTTAPTSMVSAQKKGRTFPSCHDQERDIVLLRSKEKIISVVTEEEGENNTQVQQCCNVSATRRMPMPREIPATWNSSHQPLRTLEGDASSFDSKQKNRTQEHMPINERLSSESTMRNTQIKRVSPCTSGTKDFVAFNRNLSGRTRMRSPTKVDSSKFDMDKKPCNRQHNSLSHVRTLERKRRTPNVTQVEGTASVNSIGVKPRNLHYDGRDFDASSMKSSNVKSKQGGRGKTIKVDDNKINEVISFAFNSPMKQKLGIPSEKEETSNNNERKTFFQRPSTLRVDDLGAFLEQKLKELTSQEDEELATGAPPKKSSAVILQELISALGSEQLLCHDDHHMLNENAGLHYPAKQDRLSVTSCNGNHLSPGSVLEASFSSSSLDECSGHGFHPDSGNYSYDQMEHLKYDYEVLDSATSFNKPKICAEKLTDLVNQIPKALQSLYSFGTILTTSKLTHMKDVILNAELVLGLSTNRSDDEVPQLLISRLLFDELDTMVDDVTFTDFNLFVGCEDDSKQRNELKGFLFDCVIEYLESNLCRYFNCGFKAWTKLSLCRTKPEILAQEVMTEMKKSACMVGMVPDEIIEWEMSHSLGKWTDFDIEAFDAGVDIDGDILQILVDEIVEDFVSCNLGSICL
ncbi:hypothetical protein Lal_00009288 [Lupinus albus]|uniref:Uncharacterized protein n=1 Tax=Lupinus albus TaxID=3870 RepID=A0A6A5LRU7_LUPAL|nr:hypothetical protein Lalb_Chr17g0335941 [Lupinus albus]KAF1862908.1 hypothetical protein Lal_00009288 [Lupinus albus]